MGKRQRHSEFVGLTDEQLIALVADPSTPRDIRRKADPRGEVSRPAQHQKEAQPMSTNGTSPTHGKYRIRTWLRGALPWSVAQAIPKGPDCGAHELYRQSADRDACYHCRVTRAHEPVSASERELEILQRAMRAGSAVAADALAAQIREGSAHVVPAEPPAG
jgi:hypothetical protein